MNAQIGAEYFGAVEIRFEKLSNFVSKKESHKLVAKLKIENLDKIFTVKQKK